MDSISRMSQPRIIRGAREEDRLRRIDAAPYDAPLDQSSQVSLTASKRLLNYVKSTMTGAVSAIKKHILHQSSTPTLKTIPLTQSVQFQPLPQGIFDGIASSIQQTISKPEYAAKYTVENQSPQLSKKPSLMSVVDYYKDVSTEKVRETIQRQSSKSFAQSSDCQIRPEPVYSTKNQAIVEARRQKEKNGLNKYNKRELHSILHHKEKPSKGNKKVSFISEVPDLKRSHSSIIKYSSSDEEDSASFYDKPRKQIFIDSNVVLKKEPTIQFSLIKTKKLKPNPYHKKRLVEKISKITEKGYHKQFKGEYDGKFNQENSFGSDHLIHDSKVETDSDDSGVLGEPRNFSIYKNMGNNKKNKRNHFDSSSDKEEQSSSQKESPKLGMIEEEEAQLELESQDSAKKPAEDKKIVEEAVKPAATTSQEAPKTSSLFSGSLATAAKTETTQPKSLLSTITEQPKEEKKTEVKSMFSGFNNKPSMEVVPEAPKEKPVIAESKPVIETTTAQAQQPASSLFGGSSLFGKGNIGTEATPAPQKSTSLFGQKEEAPKPTEPVVQPKVADPELSKKLDVSEEAMKDPIFSSIRGAVQPQQFNANPFLQKVDSFINPFTNTATPVVNQTENKENNSAAMNTNSVPTSVGGILEMFNSKSTNESIIPKKELVGVGNSISLFSQASETGNTESKGLFGNLSGGVFAQKNLERQGSSLFSADNNAGSGLARQNSLFGNENVSTNTNNLFSGNNNNNSMSFGNNGNSGNTGNSLFGGNNGMERSGSSLFGGASNTGSGVGSMFGGNNNNAGSSLFGGSSMQQNDLSSNPFTASFAGGNMGGGMGGGLGGGSFGSSSGGNTFGSGTKRKGQKERAF